MNIHFDIGHPAHVHLFKHLSWNLIGKGHQVFFSVRTGENETALLKEYGFNFKAIGVKRTQLLGKILGIITFTLRILIQSSRNKADLYISHGSMYAGYAAWFRRKPHIAMEDTGNMEQLRLSLPVSHVILTPDIVELPSINKRISYKGYHELIYLNPEKFIPDPNINASLGIGKNETYCILRFIAWGATHDFGHSGFCDKEKHELIDFLKRNHRVFIVSERPIGAEFKEYEFPLKPHRLHDAIAGSEIVISEGATIAAESAVLGIPSIYFSTIERCYLIEDLESYGLAFRVKTAQEVITRAVKILNTEGYKSEFQVLRKNMLSDKINVTAFFTWFVENFPESKQIMQEKPNIQYEFNT